MTFKWDCYVYLAEGLVQAPVLPGRPDLHEGAFQANYRAALSRAYYGLFNGACDYLRESEKDDLLMQLDAAVSEDERKKILEQIGSMHSYVARKLKSDVYNANRNELRKKLRRTLLDLKERRVEADYRRQITFAKNTAKQSVNNAVQCIHTVQALKDR